MNNSDQNKTVVLVGRPNVGKSTLFNRLIGKRKAIETDIPGTTRDSIYGEVFWRGQSFDLVDLAGIEFGSKKEIDQNIQAGVKLATDNADLIIFVVDWNEKDNEGDLRIARSLRKISDKVILAVNKSDNLNRLSDADSFSRLGDFSAIPVSAISGKNSGDLLDLVVSRLGKEKKKKKEASDSSIRLAVIGRPNVGKSTLINTIIGEKRAVVSQEAGTTRDVVEINFFHKGTKINLLDTAGIRRPGKIKKDTIESFSLLRTYRAIKECDIAIILIDAVEGLVATDVHILGQAKEWGKGVVLAINKTDLWEDADRELNMAKTLGFLQVKLNFAPWVPTVFISAQNELNIKPLLNQVVIAFNNRKTKLLQSDLTEILQNAKGMNSQLVSLTSITQNKTSPPVFKIMYKGRTNPHKTQIRYLENKIRDVFPLTGTPVFIDLVVKGKQSFNVK